MLIDAVVRETTVLIAQLATTGGARAPLAHVAGQVFIELSNELRAQGVSRKITADMFGLGLRSYRRKIQRLSESSTERGRSLWQAVYEFLSDNGVATKAAVLARFNRDDPALVGGVLHDLSESGLIFRAGRGPSALYRLASDEELEQQRSFDLEEGRDSFLLAVIYREGPLTLDEIITLSKLTEREVRDSVVRMVADAKLEVDMTGEGEAYRCPALVVEAQTGAGWEAAVYDHYRAVVRTVCRRLQGIGDSALEGGSTYTFQVWPGHPLYEEVNTVLSSYRDGLSALRARVDEHNRDAGIPDEHDRVIVYAGLSKWAEESEEGEDDQG